jgi:hypothetical protein
MRTLGLRFAGTFLAFFLIVGFLPVQSPTGLPPFGSFSGGTFDTVNNANLDVHFEVPVLSKPGRGLPFYYILAHDTSIWSQVQINGTWQWVPAGMWGWSGINAAILGYVGYQTQSEEGQCFWNGEYYYYYWTNYSQWTYYDTSGTAHPFSLTLGSTPLPAPPSGCQPPPPQ